MGLVIAILLTLALAGSVLWVMPSPREKRLTALRADAMRRGLRVRILDKGMGAKLFPWLDDYRGYVLYEYQVRTPIAGVSGVRVVRLNEAEEVHELDQDAAAIAYVRDHDFLTQLPACAAALVFYPGSVAVLWREQDAESAELIASVLQRSVSEPMVS